MCRWLGGIRGFCLVSAAEAMGEVLVSAMDDGGGIVFAAIYDGSGAFGPELQTSGVLWTVGKRRREDVSVGSEHEGGFGVQTLGTKAPLIALQCGTF